MTVGDRIRTAREAMDMTQEELGKICGVKKQTIFKYENNIITNIPFDKLKLISKELKVSVPKLMDWETENGGIDFGIAQYETGLSEDEVEDLISTPAPNDALKKDLSEKEKDHIKKYRSLDSYGKEAVDNILDIEWRRCDDDTQFLKDTAPEEDPKIIPLYLFPAAAGYASPVFNEDYEDYELKPEDPQGAMFAVRLQGDSMEPDFPDGSIVFCNKDPMADGDIGIFSVDSGSVCKQYHKEGGVVYLFSLNRARQDADVVLFPSGNRPLSCQGRVITRKRYQVPGR